MTIYFDLDGTLRDLCTLALGMLPNNWEYKNKYGENLVDVVNKYPWMCEHAQPLGFVDVVNKLKLPIVILTSQPMTWRGYTERWLRNHIKIPYDVEYVEKISDKSGRLKDGDVLVDDYPMFDDYSRVILIRQPWNANVHVMGCWTPSQLERIFEEKGWI